MNSVYGSYLTQQLMYQLPLVLASLVGIILSLVFWGRCRGSSALTLLAAVVLLVTAIVIPFAQTYLFTARLAQGWTVETYSRLSTIVGLVGAVVRGFAIIGLVIAVFIGRKRSSISPV